MRNLQVVRGLLAALVVLVCAGAAASGSFTWDGEAGDAQWSSPANWDPDGIPGLNASVAIKSPAPTFTGASRLLSDLSVIAGGQLIVATSSSITFATPLAGLLNTEAIFLQGGLELGGMVVNSGSILVGSDQASIPAVLTVMEFGATVTGGGNIVMDFRSEIRSATGAERLQINGQRVRGQGVIRSDFDNRSGSIITADVEMEELILTRAVGSVSSSNQGIIRASGQGVLRMIDLILDNSGGQIAALPGSEVRLEDPTIIGGTLTTEATGVLRVPATSALSLTNVVITHDPSFSGHVDLRVGNRSDLAINGTIENRADIEIVNDSAFANNIEVDAGGATLSGSGTIRLSGPNVGVRGSSGAFLTILAQRISGEGFVGQNTINFNVGAAGAIAADAGRIVLDPQSLILNDGFLEARNGGTLQLGTGSLTNNGDITAFEGAVFGSAVLTNNSDGVLSGGFYRVVDVEFGASMAFSGPGVTTIAEDTSIFLFGPVTELSFGGVPLEGSVEQIDGLLDIGARDFVRTISSSLTVNGTLKVGPAGTFDVNGDLIVGPSASIGGGGTIIAESIVNGGNVSPGESPGVLVLDSDVVFEESANLEVELGGLAAGTEFDRLEVTGSLNVAGTLAVTLNGGFLPSITDSFQVVSAQVVTGGFSNVAADGTLLSADGRWICTVNYTPGTVVLSDFAPAPGIFSDGFEQ